MKTEGGGRDRWAAAVSERFVTDSRSLREREREGGGQREGGTDRQRDRETERKKRKREREVVGQEDWRGVCGGRRGKGGRTCALVLFSV